MNDFNFWNPTMIEFGKNAIARLGDFVKPFGDHVLFVYGGGSIKKSDLYQKVRDTLNDCGKMIFELSGVTPNPRTDKVYEGIEICKNHGIDLILAVGGGSVIDCAKAISAGSKTDRDFWDAFYVKNELLEDATPIGTVLTLAGTGSEMNGGSVISNLDVNLKEAYASPLLFPKFSILDPTYTLTLPKHQMIYGAVDVMSHVFEQYFSLPEDDNPSDALSEAILTCMIRNVRKAVKNPQDYEARSNMMWCATLGLNGLISRGKEEDWATHHIEHALSAFYDIPHGAGLAVVTPKYMEYTYRSGLSKYARYAKNVWGIEGDDEEELAKKGIAATAAFFREIGAPSTLEDVGIPETSIAEMAATVDLNTGGYLRLHVKDVENILRNCL